jgi:hypothetical protein
VIELLPELGLNPEVVERQFAIDRGYGNAYKLAAADGKDPILSYIAAASYFRRAAATAILLDEIATARNLFQLAANCYLVAGRPYGYLLQALGTNHLDSNSAGNTAEEPNSVFRLWAPSAGDPFSSFSVSLRRQADSCRSQLLGPMALPGELYLEVVDAVARSIETSSIEPVAHAIFPFVALYAAAMKRAREDSYHWARLATTVHPADPEVLAILVAVQERLKSTELSLTPTLAALPIDRSSRTILTGTLEHFSQPSDFETYTHSSARNQRPRAMIDLEDDWEIRYWAKLFGISEQQLRNVVAEAGPSVMDVRSRIRRN